MTAPAPDLNTLVGLFFPTPAEVGQFSEVIAADMPQPYRTLLAHDQHMTVTVEAFHGCLVDVRVLQRQSTATHYARLILLARQRDGGVVQFGVMRVRLDCLSDDVRREIESERTPLGRILIRHGVLLSIELHKLWRVAPGPALCRMLELPAPRATYGRTALIHTNGVPAVELLEIVAPVAEMVE